MALARKDGTPLWEKPFLAEGAIGATPALAGGRLFITLDTNEIRALDAEAGDQLWRYSREHQSAFTLDGHAAPVVWRDSVLTGFSDGVVTALRAEDGAVLWERSLGGERSRFHDVDGTPVIVGDTLYASSNSGGVYASIPKTARSAGTPTCSEPRARSSPATASTSRRPTSASFAPSTARAASSSGERVSTGGPRPRPSLPGISCSFPPPTHIQIVSAQDGRVLARYAPVEGISAPPAVVDGWMVALTNKGPRPRHEGLLVRTRRVGMSRVRSFLLPLLSLLVLSVACSSGSSSGSDTSGGADAGANPSDTTQVQGDTSQPTGDGVSTEDVVIIPPGAECAIDEHCEDGEYCDCNYDCQPGFDGMCYEDSNCDSGNYCEPCERACQPQRKACDPCLSENRCDLATGLCQRVGQQCYAPNPNTPAHCLDFADGNSYCGYPCINNYGCNHLPGYECLELPGLEGGQCVPLLASCGTGTECEGDGECPYGEICNDYGLCAVGCQDDDACPTGEVCSAFRCQEACDDLNNPL